MLTAKIPSRNITVREGENGLVQLKVAHIKGELGDIAARADNGFYCDDQRGWLSEAELSGYVGGMGTWRAGRKRDELDTLRNLFRRGETALVEAKRMIELRTPERTAAHRRTASENLAAMITTLEDESGCPCTTVICGTKDAVGKQVRDCFHTCRTLFNQVSDIPLAEQAYRMAENVYRRLTHGDCKLPIAQAIEYLQQLKRSVDNMLAPSCAAAALTGTSLI